MTGACQVLKEDDMSAKGAFGFVAGGILGAAAGVVAGILLAPRSGAESRAMAADAMNDACFPGNPREATHEDVVELFKKICPEA